MRRIALATAVVLTAIGVLPNASAQTNTFTVDCNRMIEGNGTDDGKPGAGVAVSQSQAGMLNNNTIRYNREDGVIVTAGGIATIDDNTIVENE